MCVRLIGHFVGGAGMLVDECFGIGMGKLVHWNVGRWVRGWLCLWVGVWVCVGKWVNGYVNRWAVGYA